jgi:predicted amidophosphoribosyltransferase
MTKRSCNRCGSDLTNRSRFCASCGAIAPLAETANLDAPEPSPLCGKQTEQTIPPHAAVTEEMPAILTARKASCDNDEAGSQP